MRTFTCIFLSLLLAGMTFGQTVPKKKPIVKKAISNARAAGGKTFTVSGKVEQTYPYCGGAAPTEEMRINAQTAVPYPGKKFYVRKGKVNTTSAPIAASFTTDENGNFTVQLPPGTYSIILPEQLNTIRPEDLTSQYIVADTACMRTWWSAPYYLLVVKSRNVTGLSFKFHHRCFIDSEIPCLRYDGPAPP